MEREREREGERKREREREGARGSFANTGPSEAPEIGQTSHRAPTRQGTRRSGRTRRSRSRIGRGRRRRHDHRLLYGRRRETTAVQPVATTH